MYRYRKANEGVHAPEGLKYNTANMETKRPPRLPRAALAAACLCLALVGTAGAARLIAGFWGVHGYDRYDPRTGFYYQGYTAYGGVEFIPLDRLSQEILDIAAENPQTGVTLPVSSREELEELTGLELPARLTLDKPKLHTDFVAFMSADQAGPTCIEYREYYNWWEMEPKVIRMTMEVSLYTERMNIHDVMFTGSSYLQDWEVETAEYTTAHGLSALVTRAQGMEPIENPEVNIVVYHCDALFALDGAYYRISIESGHDLESIYAILTETLEDFAL